MGLLLLSAGARGKRCAVADARIGLLPPRTDPAGGGSGSGDAAKLEETRRTIAGLLAANSGQSEERVRADWGQERWFSAEEARAYGLIDQVVPEGGGPVPRSPFGGAG